MQPQTSPERELIEGSGRMLSLLNRVARLISPVHVHHHTGNVVLALAAISSFNLKLTGMATASPHPLISSRSHHHRSVWLAAYIQ